MQSPGLQKSQCFLMSLLFTGIKQNTETVVQTMEKHFGTRVLDSVFLVGSALSYLPKSLIPITRLTRISDTFLHPVYCTSSVEA